MEDKVIRLPKPVHTRLQAMRAVLREMTGRNISQGETVERALKCMADAHAGNAWLDGAEAGRVFEERHQQQILSVVGQLLARVRPDLELDGIGFNPLTGQAQIVLRGEEAVTLEAANLTSKGE